MCLVPSGMLELPITETPTTGSIKTPWILVDNAYKWSFHSREVCKRCGESDCETEFSSSPNSKIILVRDCQPETKLRLPMYLRKEMGI